MTPSKIIGVGRELVGLRKHGEEFPMELSISEVRLKDRRLFTGIVLLVIGVIGILAPKLVSVTLSVLVASMLLLAGLAVAWMTWHSYQRNALAWLADHDVPAREVHFLWDKTLARCDVSLDDAPHQLEELSAGVPEAVVCRMVHPWNDPMDGVVDVHCDFERRPDGSVRVHAGGEVQCALLDQLLVMLGYISVAASRILAQHGPPALA